MKFKLRNETDKTAITDYISKLSTAKVFDVEIKLHKEKRSVNQNSLYWLWLTCLMAETGNDKNYLHEYFKETYLPKESRQIFDRQVSMPLSTSVLNTEQFKWYLDKIQQFAITDLSITLPDPEDQIWNQFYDTYQNYI